MKMSIINAKKFFVDSFKTRSFQVGGYSVAATAIVLAIAIAVNLFAAALPASVTQIDTTSTQLFTISEQTENIVGALESDVTIYWIVQAGYEDATIETLLDRYKSLSNKISVVKKDPDVYPTFLDSYNISSVYNNSLLVESGDRYRYVDYNDIFYLDYESYYYYGTEDWSFYGEQELTSAIDYCISENLPKAYLLTGHGESDIPTTFADSVEHENIETEVLSLLTVEYVPDDADCLLIYAPQTDISSEEKAKIETYLGNGGNLILITDPPQNGTLTNLESLMAHYGITAAEGIVVEGDQNYYAWGTPYYLLPEMGYHTITSPLTDGGYYVLLPIAQGLQIDNTLSELITVTELLTTSDDAFSKADGYDLSTYDKETGDIEGPFALAVAAEETIDDGIYSNVIWVSSGALLDEQSNEMVSGGNQDFFLNMLNYLCEPEGSGISIHAKSLSYEYLTMESSTASVLIVLMLGIIPVGYLTLGITIWFRRKRR